MLRNPSNSKGWAAFNIVARSAGADALMHSLLPKFVFDIACVMPLLVLITLGVGIRAVRNGLKPVRAVSEMPTAIGPSATSIRLPDENLLTQIRPLVVAMNHALDRLEQGLVVQDNSLRMPPTSCGRHSPSWLPRSTG